MAASKMIRGTLILTVATFISKLLGLLFVIPYKALVGSEGVFLYAFAYTPYSIILSISTMGLPLAVAKFVAKYNTLGDYETGRRLYRSGMALMSITGLVGFLFLYFGAPLIASLSAIDRQDYKNVVLVIRVVSLAIIVVPSMSLMRGYYQGFQSMGPTANSQVVEQIVRIAVILIGSFMVIKVFHGTVVTAAMLATFAAFVGAVAGFYVMLRYWIKRRRHLNELADKSTAHYHLSLARMYKELAAYAVSFVAVGVAMQLYQLVDQMTIYHFLHYNSETMTTVVADLMMNDQKVVMIPVSLATALAVSVVPAMIVSYAKEDWKELHNKITQALQFVLFLTVPAAAGLSILGYMVHGMMYGVGHDELSIGGYILRWYGPTALLFALFSVTASVLQGINRQRVTLFSLFAGVLIKIVLNPLCMWLFGMIGPIIATNAGYIASIIINFIAIKRETGYKLESIAKQSVHIVAYTFIMLVVIELIFILSGGSFPHQRVASVFLSFISVIVGGGVYLLIANWTGLLRRVLGRKLPFMNRLAKKRVH